jgi:PAS domain S-box-containing protein
MEAIDKISQEIRDITQKIAALNPADIEREKPQLVSRLSSLLDELNHAEQALRNSEERYRSIAESITDAVVIANEKGIILSWNKGAHGMFGYSQEQIIGKSLAILMPVHSREDYEQGLRRFLRTGESHFIGKTVNSRGVALIFRSRSIVLPIHFGPTGNLQCFKQDSGLNVFLLQQAGLK